MFQYYFLLGVRSLRRNPALTALMVLTLAIGVAASVSTLTILHVMSGDPIPTKSERLFVPQFDNGPLEGYTVGDEHDKQMSYPDAANLLRSGQGDRRSAMYRINASIESERKDMPAFTITGMAASRDFFFMFDTPFLHGQPWSEADDKTGADVVVLGRELAEKLFGDADPVGKRLTIVGQSFQVVGVANTWRPLPRFYRLVGGGGAFGSDDQLFIPFASAIRHEVGNYGGVSCTKRFDGGFDQFIKSECTWLQFWFEASSASGRAALQTYIDGYSADQRKLGRHMRAAPNTLYNVMEWLDYLKVIKGDSKLQVWLAFGFLALCLVNTIGLLLAKFSVRAAEVGIRRALGASRREIFQQFLIETTVVGLAGGILGLLFAYGALALIAMQSKEMATVAHMDLTMLAFTFALSVLAAIVAGLLPTWRACQVTPAMQLKSQ